MAGGEQDQFGDPLDIQVRVWPPPCQGRPRQVGRTGLVVAAPRLVHRIMEQQRQGRLARLPPAGTGCDGGVVLHHRFDMSPMVVGARRRRIGIAQLAPLRRVQVQRDDFLQRARIHARSPAGASGGAKPLRHAAASSLLRDSVAHPAHCATAIAHLPARPAAWRALVRLPRRDRRAR